MSSFKYYLPVLLWAILLFYLSHLPSTNIPSFGIEFEDLIAHFCAYSVLGYCIAIALLRGASSQRLILIALLFGITYGVSDEIHQMFVPGRFPAVSDVVADAFGVAFGLYVFVRTPGLFAALDKRVFTWPGFLE